jgi:hypothetical protein
MADLSEDLIAAFRNPEARELLREVVRQALAEALPHAAPAAAEPQPRLLTSEEMAHAVGMSRAAFLAFVKTYPQLRSRKVHGRWPEEEVRTAVRKLRTP